VVAGAAPNKSPDSELLLAACRQHLPAYMIPQRIEWRAALPRNRHAQMAPHAREVGSRCQTEYKMTMRQHPSAKAEVTNILRVVMFLHYCRRGPAQLHS